MNKLTVFENEEFGKIRTVTVNNEPYFVGKDVAEVLGYERGTKAIRDHVDEDDVYEIPIQDSIGRMQNTPVINESGLYSLILSSKMPNAKKFKHWVTSEVLPSIRKHGAYMTDDTLKQALTSPDFLIQLATELKKEKELNEQLTADNLRMKPKEIFADAVSSSDTAILVRDLAKILKQNGVDTGEKRLYKWMRENGYIIKGSTRPTQRAMELGLFEIIESTVQRADLPPITTMTTKVSGKGQQYFINKLLR